MFKYHNSSKTLFEEIETGKKFNIHSPKYKELEEWVASGGSIEPHKTESELFDEALSGKLLSLSTERKARLDVLLTTPPNDGLENFVFSIVKLMRKEIKGEATVDEIAFLDNIEIIDVTYHSARDWLSDAARTVEEIDAYDVTTVPVWP